MRRIFPTCQHPAGNAGVVCRPAEPGSCDVAEACTGSSPSCPADGFASNGAPCSDGDGCTQTDTCQGGTCTGSNPKTCTAEGECTSPGTCIPATGACSNPPVTDGTICTGGLCSSGFCRQAGNPPTAVDQTVALDLHQAYAFLYEGPNPQQIGVPAGTIKRNRIGLFHGRVLNRDSQGIKGVVVRVVGRPEYGFTQTGDDGVFSMAINGGEQLRLDYQRTGYLPVQRTEFARSLGDAWFPDVTMTAMDAARTVVDLPSLSSIAVAQATPTSDANGTRQSILMFFPGMQATVVNNDGTTAPVETLTVHSTEYTVGEQGPSAMPATLPPTSGYTYAVELTAEEAVGAKRVEFSQPVVHYVDNFLHFSVGSLVPTGFYDREIGGWAATDSGRVIRILPFVGPLADVDADGDGVADDPVSLAALGITDEERITLAGLYLAGESLWRVPLNHFSPIDHNWPIQWPTGSGDPDVDEPEPENDPDDDDDCQTGSIIECNNQILKERSDIVGTPYSLTYSSSRAPGFAAGSAIVKIALSGPSVPAGLKRIQLYTFTPGGFSTRVFPPLPNQNTTAVWNGRDLFGRRVPGRAIAVTVLSYVYQGIYLLPNGPFGEYTTPDTLPDGEPNRIEMYRNQNRVFYVEQPDAKVEDGFGGWALSNHHSYDPRTRRITFGDGSRRSATSVNLKSIPTNVNFFDFVPGPDGSMYFSFPFRQGGPFPVGPHLYRQAADGSVQIVAAEVHPHLLAIGPDGVVYSQQGVMDFGFGPTGRIGRLNLDGSVTNVAGKSQADCPGQEISGDNGPATEACLGVITDIEVGPNGDIYFVQGTSQGLILKRWVDRAGIIRPVPVDGRELGVTSDDAVYVFTRTGSNVRNQVKRVLPNGTLERVAGRDDIDPVCTDTDGSGGIRDVWCIGGTLVPGLDGSLYTTSTIQFFVPQFGTTPIERQSLVEVRHDGTFAELFPGLQVDVRRFRIDSNGEIIATVRFPAQNPPSAAQYWGGGGFFRMGTASPPISDTLYNIASSDGGEIYSFDRFGRHLRTLDAMTSTTKFEFGYSATGYVTGIADRNGRTTIVERDGSGQPTGIVSPAGQRTALTLDSDGYLEKITSPGGAQQHFEYSDGLLTREVDARGGIHTFTYADGGRIIKDQGPVGGGWDISRVDQGPAGELVTMTTAGGMMTTYAASNSFGAQSKSGATFKGTRTRLVTSPNGLVTALETDAFGNSHSTSPDGTVIEAHDAPDPRFGMSAPFTTRQVVTMPSGLSVVFTGSRSAVTASDGVTLVSQTDRVAVNGRETVSTYDAASRTTTRTSPTGRTSVHSYDDHGRLVRVQAGTLAPRTFTYDGLGRLVSTTFGTGGQARQTRIDFDSLESAIRRHEPDVPGDPAWVRR